MVVPSEIQEAFVLRWVQNLANEQGKWTEFYSCIMPWASPREDVAVDGILHDFLKLTHLMLDIAESRRIDIFKSGMVFSIRKVVKDTGPAGDEEEMLQHWRSKVSQDSVGWRRISSSRRWKMRS